MGTIRVESIVNIASIIVVETDRRRTGNCWRASSRGQQLYRHFWAGDDRTTLIRAFFNCAVLANRLGEGTNPQVTHQHSIVTRAVQAWFVRYDSIAFRIVLKIIVAPSCGCKLTKLFGILICVFLLSLYRD